MSEQLKRRQDIPRELTWDLTHLFATEAEYEAAVEKNISQADGLERKYKGKIAAMTDVAGLIGLIKEYEQFLVSRERAAIYAHLDMAVDMTDNAVVARYQKLEAVDASLSSQTSFISSELMEVADDLLLQVKNDDPAYSVFIDDILRRKKHRLGAETESVLAALTPSLELPFTIYEQTKHADMDFGRFTAGDKELPLSFVLFENEYNLEADTEIRRRSFEKFSATLKQYENTVATAYNSEVQKQKTMARLRGYSSVFDYLLDEQKVKRDLYDRQIDLIMQELAPHMQRYARLLQKTCGLEKMTFADLKVPLDPQYDPRVTIEQSKQYISDGLSALGQDYHDLVMQAYDQRWVDFAENKGKSTGGFCASPYQVHGYILLSWTGRLSEVFTLAHELGHAAHFTYAQKENPYLACDTSLYFVEAPSTINELFLAGSLLAQNKSDRFQRWVLASLIQNTYYHNFVTHLLEAAFQREVYRRVDAGQHLQAAQFSAIKREVLEKFWGDAVEINPGAELTWMRQPHYYMGLYSYSYSAGLTIATEVNRKIEKEGQPAVDAWLSAIRAGGTVNPLEFAARAGVDINSEKPLRQTINYIGATIAQIEALS